MEKKKRFGIDIDGTVTCPSTFIPYLNESFNTNLTIDDITDYDLLPFLNVTEEQLNRWMDVYEPIIYSRAPLAPGALDVINSWKNTYELYYISARGRHLYEVTERWFRQHGVHYHHIELIGSHDKREAVKTYGIDVFFEDKHDNACDIAEQCGIPVILFDTPYNRRPLPTGVIRVYNWYEAKEQIERLFCHTKS